MSQIKRLAISSGVLSLLLVSIAIAAPVQSNSAETVTDVAAITQPATAYVADAAANEKPKSDSDAKDDAKKAEKEPAKAGPFKPTQEQIEAINKLWLDSWESAKAKAETNGKPILIYFTHEKCGYCRHLENIHFPYPEAAALLENEYVLYKIDLTDGAREKIEFYKTYNKEFGTPTMLILDTEKNKILTRVGVNNRGKLLAMLKDGLKKFQQAKAAKAAAKSQAAAEVKTTN